MLKYDSNRTKTTKLIIRRNLSGLLGQGVVPDSKLTQSAFTGNLANCHAQWHRFFVIRNQRHVRFQNPWQGVGLILARTSAVPQDILNEDCKVRSRLVSKGVGQRKSCLSNRIKVTSNHLDLESTQVESKDFTSLEQDFLIQKVSHIQLVIFADHN